MLVPYIIIIFATNHLFYIYAYFYLTYVLFLIFIFFLAKDTFNWTKYLLDGEEKYMIHYHDTYDEVQYSSVVQYV